MKDEKVELNTLISSRLLAKAKRVCTEKQISMNQFVYRAFSEYLKLLKEREELKGKKWIRYVLENTPQKDSKAEKIVKYLVENRLEGLRQVYFIPDLSEKCELSKEEIKEFNFISYGFTLKGSDISCGFVHAVMNSLKWGDFLILDVGGEDGWGVLVEMFNGRHGVKEPREEVKNFIVWLDSEEGKTEMEKFHQSFVDAFNEWLWGVVSEEEEVTNDN